MQLIVDFFEVCYRSLHIINFEKMAIEKISVEKFLALSQTYLVIDVRSPSEYSYAHIPSANNIVLFNDEERKIVGTAYKQQSRKIAIKLGLDFFGVKMKSIVEEVEQLAVDKGQDTVGKQKLANVSEQNKISADDCQLPTANCILINCWRGGMRSAAVAWLLDLYGYKVYTLQGGYKAYRNWVLQQFENEYFLKIIGGYTGSGKTLLLKQLEKNGEPIIDLEALANHKGSALGALGQAKQPTQEMFENLLTAHLANYQLPTANCIWIEDESQRIGNLQIPISFWKTMRNSVVYFFDIPFEERLDYLTKEYGIHKKDELVTAIMRIQKRLGGLETKNAINFLLENNFTECFRILLTYYDKWYAKGLYNRENAEALIKKIEAEKVDVKKNVSLLGI